MHLFVDSSLACRLERAEGRASTSFVEARTRIDPTARAAHAEIAGALLSFDGETSPITQTFALGMSGPVTEEDLAAIESFFTSRGAPIHHEVSLLAGARMHAVLAERGYRPAELSNVLVRPLESSVASPRGEGLHARPARAEEESLWVEAAVRGWAESAEYADMIRGFSPIAFANASMTSYLVEIDGAVVATGSLGIFDGIALLAGASTVPEARNRGAQRALLAARLAEAARRGCTVAMMATEPGSVSQRNAETRSGFQVAYSRTKWTRAPDGRERAEGNA